MYGGNNEGENVNHSAGGIFSLNISSMMMAAAVVIGEIPERDCQMADVRRESCFLSMCE
jgi:hypothetical protein